MGKFTKGENPQTVALNFNTNAPLDDRTVVTTKASLIGKDTWIKAEYLFKGLITSVLETNELYMYIGNIGTTFPDDFLADTTTTTPNVSDETIAKYWKKVSSSGLENLSGVFAFKGVAYSISDDLSVLTCGKAYVVTNLDGPDAYKYIVCKSTAYDMAGELYYSWADEDGNILFWTDSTVLNSSASLYDRQKGSFSLYYVTDGLGEKYYLNTNTPMTTGDDTEGIDWGKCLLFWHEDCKDSADYANIKAIYCPGGLEALKDGDTFQTVNGATYTYNEETVTVHIIKSVYTFTTKTLPYDIYTSGNGSDKPILDGMTSVYTVLAAPENAGYVYQILENEYASNGTIWVKLGSPVEDWIIL